MEALVVGVITAFNFIIIKWKVEKKRYDDATLDVFVMGVLSYLFGGTMSGMVVAMVASCVVSLYLLANPPDFSYSEDSNDT